MAACVQRFSVVMWRRTMSKTIAGTISQQRKIRRNEMRDFLVDGAELWLGGHELQNPHKTQMHGGIGAGDDGGGPAIFRCARSGREPDRRSTSMTTK